MTLSEKISLKSLDQLRNIEQRLKASTGIESTNAISTLYTRITISPRILIDPRIPCRANEFRNLENIFSLNEREYITHGLEEIA